MIWSFCLVIAKHDWRCMLPLVGPESQGEIKVFSIPVINDPTSILPTYPQIVSPLISSFLAAKGKRELSIKEPCKWQKNLCKCNIFYLDYVYKECKKSYTNRFKYSNLARDKKIY